MMINVRTDKKAKKQKRNIETSNSVLKQVRTEQIKKSMDHKESWFKRADKALQSIIAEMQRGQASIDARKQVINSCENKITALSTDLDAFTFELIEQK